MISAKCSRATLFKSGLRRCLALRNPLTGINAATFIRDPERIFLDYFPAKAKTWRAKRRLSLDEVMRISVATAWSRNFAIGSDHVLVFCRDQQRVEEILIACATPSAEASRPHAFISLCAGPEIALAPMIGLTPTFGALLAVKAERIPGTARIGPILVIGLLGPTMIAAARSIASSTPGAGRLDSTPAKRIAVTSARPVFLDKKFLKGNFSLRRLHARFNALVGHGQNRRLDAQGAADSVGRLRQSETFIQESSARDMRRQVFVAEIKPRVIAQPAKLVQSIGSVVFNAPTFVAVGEASQAYR